MLNLSDSIERKFQDVIEIDDEWEIETDTGFQPISKIMKTIPYEKWKLVLEDGYSLEAADDHIVFDKNMNEVFVKNLKINDLVQTKNGLKKVISCSTNNQYEEMFDIEVNDNNHRLYTNDILSHNTTCAAAFILWKVVTALKEKKETILVTANKLSQAQEILERIKYSYGLLPKWLVPGVIKNNERSMVFDNGSKILCRATTSDAGRGLSPTLVYIDEMAFIKKSIAAAFMTAIKPTLATGGKMFITSTPMNDEDEFAKIWNGAIDRYDSNGMEIEGGEGSNGFFPLKFTYKDHPHRNPEIYPKWEMDWKASIGEARFRQEFSCLVGNTDIKILGGGNNEITMTLEEMFKLLGNNQ